jgi:hypothetical protein
MNAAKEGNELALVNRQREKNAKELAPIIEKYLRPHQESRLSSPPSFPKLERSRSRPKNCSGSNRKSTASRST